MRAEVRNSGSSVTMLLTYSPENLPERQQLYDYLESEDRDEC